MLVIQYGPLAWPIYSGGSFPLQTPSSGAGFSVLHDANFRSFLSSSITQQIGHRMGLFVLSWLILEKTDSPLQLGFGPGLPYPAYSHHSDAGWPHRRPV